MRGVLLMLLATASSAADETLNSATAPAATRAVAFDGIGHRWPAQEVRFYVYTLEHRVSWRSAGDHLTYEQELTWDGQAVGRGGDGELGVGLYITRLRARHRGPEGERRFDSARPDDPRDHNGVGRALLGDLAIFDGARFELHLASATGGVTVGPGSRDLAGALNQRHPAQNPAFPAPLSDQANQALSPQRLGQFFTRLFEVPGQDGPLDLGAPLSGSVQRRWQGGNWTVALGAQAPSLAISRHPGGMLTMKHLSGGGGVEMSRGVLQRSHATLHYTLSGAPFTQVVEQHHELTWSWELVAPGK
jgi:hypothetical protein